jgi:hypothetical protein
MRRKVVLVTWGFNIRLLDIQDNFDQKVFQRGKVSISEGENLYSTHWLTPFSLLF